MLLQAVADGVRKLRVLHANQWADDAVSQLQSEQLSDMMRLYVDEVCTSFSVCLCLCVPELHRAR